MLDRNRNLPGQIQQGGSKSMPSRKLNKTITNKAKLSTTESSIVHPLVSEHVGGERNSSFVKWVSWPLTVLAENQTTKEICSCENHVRLTLLVRKVKVFFLVNAALVITTVAVMKIC